MNDREKYPSEAAERFQVRMPLGLRDRIKAASEAEGRSMNTEIVRALLRAFPEPTSADMQPLTNLNPHWNDWSRR